MIRKTLKNDTWLKNFFKNDKKLLFLVIFLSFLTAICASGLMFVSGYLISKSSTRPYNILIVYIPIVLTRFFGILRPVFRYLQRLTSHNWVFKMTSKLRSRLYTTIEKTGIFHKNIFKSGKLLSTLTEDIGNIQNFYLRSIFPFIVAILVYVTLLILSGILNLYLAIFTFIFLVVMLICTSYISYILSKNKVSELKIRKEKLYTIITDNIMGILDYCIHSNKKDFFEKIDEEDKILEEKEKNLYYFVRIRNLIIQTLFITLVIAFIIYTGYVFNTTFSKNYIAAFILAIFPLSDTFFPIYNGIDDITYHIKSVENLNNLDNEIKEDKKEISSIKNSNIALKIENLNFSYNNNESILKEFNLEIKDKEKVCILGRSGAGKSSLLKIIRGDITKYSGKVSVYGLDPKKIDLSKSNIIGVLNQKPWIFNTTIYNNIRIANEKIKKEEVKKIIKMVELSERINDIDEVLIETGSNLSGGEKQRIALARILSKNDNLILLDEPTVGLDPLTENSLLNTVFEVLKDKTVIWVTHHLQGIEKMDRLLYIEDGKIVIDGNPKKLIEENEFINKLYKLDKGI